MTVQVGDWVCWKQLGLPSYAKVEYVMDKEVVTTTGTCYLRDILEVRPPQVQG